MTSPFFSPCPEWAEHLALAHSTELSPMDRAALAAHLASCLACKAVLEEYRAFDDRLHSILLVRKPLELSSALLHVEDAEAIREMNRGKLPHSIPIFRRSPHLSSPLSLVGRMFNTLAAILVIGVLISSFYALYSMTHTGAFGSTVTINFAPRLVSLEEIYPVTANASAQRVDVSNSIIPIHVSTKNLTVTQTGPTTGQVNCTLGVFGCQQGVAQGDVDNLAAQMQPGLENQIAQLLQGEIVGTGGIQVTNIKYAIISTTPTPAIGQVGNTVKVVMGEQGRVGYVVSADTTNVARNALMNQVKQMGPNYTLLSNTVVIGRPVIQSINTTSGQVNFKIAASGVALYQFPDAQLQYIHNNIKGKTLSDARDFLASQRGIDPQTIAIHFTRGSGNTLPDSIQRISIVPINARFYPSVHLKTEPSPTSTSSANTTPIP